jgi:hypothetical protein
MTRRDIGKLCIFPTQKTLRENAQPYRFWGLLGFPPRSEGDISLATISQAGAICEWFIHEFKRLFSSMPDVPLEVSDALELERFLMEWCLRHSGQPYILKSLIAQYGPNQLRPSSNKGRREYAINQLVMEGKIWIVFEGKKKWIQLNPQYFPIHSVAQSYQPAISY